MVNASRALVPLQFKTGLMTNLGWCNLGFNVSTRRAYLPAPLPVPLPYACPPFQAVVDMLLAVNVNVNARDSQGHSALLEAARGGHEEVITALMARGARLNMDSQALAQVTDRWRPSGLGRDADTLALACGCCWSCFGLC